MELSSKITLYSFVDQDRSGRVRWTASELGIEYEERRIKPGEQSEPEYLKINPWGRIPAIVSNGMALSESGAICTWLAEQRPESELIVPPGSEDRAAYLQWQFLACTTLEEAAYRVYFEDQPEESDLERLYFLLTRVDEHLKSAEFLVAGRFTLVDILTAYVLELCRRRELIGDYANIRAYLRRMGSRPAAIEAGLFLSRA